jgi:hypothetical protein
MRKYDGFSCTKWPKWSYAVQWEREGCGGMFFFHICDVEILTNFAPKIMKLVKITLEKHIS